LKLQLFISDAVTILFFIVYFGEQTNWP